MISIGQVARFFGPGLPLIMQDEPVPELGEGEILLAVELAAVCGSDLHTIEGRRGETVPSVLGHEGVGTVVASHRSGVREGSRVTWSLVDSCGQCPVCLAGRFPQKCERLFKYGHGGNGLDGTYGSHLRIRAGTAVFAVPDTLDLRLAATANCALATGVEALLAPLPEPGRALVLGGGLVGLFMGFLLSDRGWKVDVQEAHPTRASFASGLGLEVVDTPRGRYRLLVEAAGVASLLSSAYASLEAGAEIRLVGLVHPDSALGLTAEDLIRRCWTVRGSHNYRPRALEQALEAAERFQARLDLDRALGPVFGLREINQALAAARKGESLRVLVQP